VYLKFYSDESYLLNRNWECKLQAMTTSEYESDPPHDNSQTHGADSLNNTQIIASTDSSLEEMSILEEWIRVETDRHLRAAWRAQRRLMQSCLIKLNDTSTSNDIKIDVAE
jgi:hypothetical protein